MERQNLNGLVNKGFTPDSSSEEIFDDALAADQEILKQQYSNDMDGGEFQACSSRAESPELELYVPDDSGSASLAEIISTPSSAQESIALTKDDSQTVNVYCFMAGCLSFYWLWCLQCSP